jgi:hypothetical protein
MNRSSLALIGIAAIGAAAVLFLISAFDWLSWTCRLPNPTSEPSRPFALGPGGCVEFWIFRYQTLIAAILAFGTALIALGPARGQLIQIILDASQREMQELRIRYYELAEFRLVLNKLASAIEVADRFMQSFVRSHPDTDEPIERGKLALAAHEALTPLISALPQSLGKPWGDEKTFEARRRLSDSAHEFGSAVSPLARNLERWENRGMPHDERARVARASFFAKADAIYSALIEEEKVIEARMHQLRRV